MTSEEFKMLIVSLLTTILLILLFGAFSLPAKAIELKPPEAPNSFQAGTSVLSLTVDPNKTYEISFKAKISDTTLNSAQIVSGFGGYVNEFTLTKNFQKFKFIAGPAEWETSVFIKAIRGNHEEFVVDEVGGSLMFYENPDSAHTVVVKDFDVFEITDSAQCIDPTGGE